MDVLRSLKLTIEKFLQFKLYTARNRSCHKKADQILVDPGTTLFSYHENLTFHKTVLRSKKEMDPICWDSDKSKSENT